MAGCAPTGRFAGVGLDGSRDIYAGGDQPDPNNPNTTPDGLGRTVNGLFATKAAIRFARSLYPTLKTFLHGGSAGSAGAFGVAWALQLQGVAPAGAVADSGVVNYLLGEAQIEQQACEGGGRSQAALEAVGGAVALRPRQPRQPGPTSGRAGAADPCRACTSGAGPTRTCAAPRRCRARCPTAPPRRLGRPTACASRFGPRSRDRARAARRATCASASARPPARGAAPPRRQNKNGTNTDPAEAADYNATIMGWVHAGSATPRGGRGVIRIGCVRVGGGVTLRRG